jgi:hypothetical protein
MTRPCHRCKRVEPAGAGLSALAERLPSRTRWAFGRVSGALIGSAEAFDLRYAVTLSANARLCYRLRCLGGVIWEIPVEMTSPSGKPIHSTRRRPIVAALSLLALIALPACSGKVDIDPAALEMPTPLVERLPITVGVHYDEALLNHYHLEKHTVGSEFEYRLGPPTKALFDQVFSTMFETIVPVEGSSTATVDGQKVAGVLSLRIETFVAWNHVPRGAGWFDVIFPRIVYSATLYAPPGVKKTSIRGDGIGKLEGLGEWLPTVVARAMRNAAAVLVVNFYNDPEVKAWLASLGIAEPGAEGTSQ